jgi:alpha-beta hydrolase superfamily lysophospholipase
MIAWLAHFQCQDLKMYAVEDENSPLFEKKRAITSLLRENIEELAERRSAGHYDRLVVVGHSLGSQLILDALLDIAADSLGSAGPSSLKARRVILQVDELFTLGSPIARFMAQPRVRANHDWRWRQNRLKWLFSENYKSRRNAWRIAWHNLFYTADPVGAPIQKVFDVSEQLVSDEELGSYALIACHSAYLSDSRILRSLGLLK